MMKNIAFLSATVAMLILSGCSTKEPVVDATTKNSGNSVGTSVAPAVAVTATDSNAVIAPITNASATDTSVVASNGMNGSDAQLVSILFDYDKFDIRENMQEAMTKNALLVKEKTIKLEGNCDEFGSDEYNFALGLKRATAVKAVLVNRGINADSI
ncbi:OmpA family protein, partial [Sulfuricurvum sp.]|uniref:OmpA family protein n=1 Tax=Sulfuricurvum sp. TaxID=2025608 RepID=UPI003BB57E6D